MAITTTTIEVPIPKEFKELAREMGVKEEELVKAVQRLLVVEIAVIGSKLTREEALKLADEVERSAWKSLR